MKEQGDGLLTAFSYCSLFRKPARRENCVLNFEPFPSLKKHELCQNASKNYGFFPGGISLVPKTGHVYWAHRKQENRMLQYPFLRSSCPFYFPCSELVYVYLILLLEGNYETLAPTSPEERKPFQTKLYLLLELPSF